MGEVRPDRPLAGVPAIAWHDAALRLVTISIAGQRERRRGRRRGLQLALPPCDEIGLAFDVDDERHVRVLRAAEFGALAAIDADLASGAMRDVGVAAGDQVLLAGEVRHPEAVDDVVGLEHDARRHADRQVKLVRGAEGLRSVGPSYIRRPTTIGWR